MVASAVQHDAEADAEGPAIFIITLPDSVRGRLEEAHLADHPAAVAALAECIEPGTDLGDLLVLERLEACSSFLCTMGICNRNIFPCRGGLTAGCAAESSLNNRRRHYAHSYAALARHVCHAKC